jgi:CDP-glycerol glycerophosphotransferase (TagB/SpsB family)
MFISDYNAHNFSYNYLDKPVIVFESAKIEYKQLSRLAVLTCIVSDKIQNERTFFNEN